MFIRITLVLLVCVFCCSCGGTNQGSFSQRKNEKQTLSCVEFRTVGYVENSGCTVFLDSCNGEGKYLTVRECQEDNNLLTKK